MLKPVRLLTVVAVAAIIGLLWARMRPADEAVAVDLIERFPTAEIKRPSAETFARADVTLAGVSRRAIVPSGPSRLGFRVTVPDSAWLDLSIGMREEAWTVEGDGVLFLVGVSDGQKFDELMSLVMNPFANPADRGWHALQLDLSPYAGKSVDVIFNTFSSPPKGGDDRRGDSPLWAEPRIVTR